jgi:hypothetical protein
MEPGFAASEVDTSKPHPARMYNAYLGGRDSYGADREGKLPHPEDLAKLGVYAGVGRRDV